MAKDLEALESEPLVIRVDQGFPSTASMGAMAPADAFLVAHQIFLESGPGGAFAQQDIGLALQIA